MKDLLIVDTRLIAYESYHKKRPFISFFNTIIENTLPYVNPNRIVFAYDSPKGSIRRKQLFPEYKAHRKELIKTKAEENKLKRFNQDYNRLENILFYFGNLIHLDGYEADDIANILTDVLKDKYNIWLLSSDKDWIVNLKQNNIKQIHLKRGLITLQNVKDLFGVMSENVIKVQALTGIKKENIKGIYKLGETRVYRWLNEGKSIDEIIDIVQEFIDKGKYGMRLPDGFNSVKEMYDFNYEVLRPLTLDDLTDEEKVLLKQQLNHKEKISKDELELKIIETFKQPLIIDRKIQSFFKIKN